MATIRISGAEERCSQPSFYIPNRIDEKVLQAILKLMGGAENVAFMMEDSFLPSDAVMRVVKASGSEILSFNFRKGNSRILREQLLNIMQKGLDIIFIPGRPNQSLGCISDVPMPFMMQLAALHIAPVPIFVGFYCNSIRHTFTSDPAEYDWATIRLLPKLAPGPLTGERLLEAWMEASSEEYSAHPLLNTSLARLLVEGMRRHANVELVDGLDESVLPYGKMLGVAMAFARWMKKNIAEPRVGVILPPGKGGVLTNYACILAGIVPVNINYTSSDAAFAAIIRQSGIQKFITARAFMSKLPQFPWPKNDRIIHLDRTLKEIGMGKIASWVAFAKFAPMVAINKVFKLDARKGDDEAALLFTSGSSGEPKGVRMTHRMLVANMTQLLSKVSPPAGEAFLASLPIFHSFGLTVSTILPPIYGYGMVTYPSPLDAKRLNELIEKYHCSLVVTTPTFARSMLRRAHEHTYDSVRYFVTGAEKLQQCLVDEFWEKCHLRVLEGYGLTETSPICGANLEEVGPTADQPWFVSGYLPGSIGHMMPGMAVRITDPDDDNKRLTFNEQGMLWFKGANVFGGYIERDDLNAEIFKDGWFKTGDLGTINLNSFLTLGGRRSRFSKVAGEMVPHEVVEQAIEEFVTIPEGFTGRAVAVMGVPDAQKGEALVLLSAVHHANLNVALEEIRNHMVGQGLPRLWCPREIIPVEAIPALPTGKMDLKGCQMLAYEALGITS